MKIKVICSSFDRKMKENIIKPLINIGMDGGWKHLLEIQQTCVFGDTGDVSAPDCALKEALLALLTQMTSCITMTGTISAHSDQKGVCTGGRSYYWRITIVYLHPEVLDGHVLLVDVHGVVLGHREHLLQVVLNIGAVLMVDCVSVARYWGTLVLKVVGLGSMTIEAYYES